MPGISDSILGSFPYRLLSEIDQPTQGQGMQNAQFGGSPGAMQSLLMSPGMQHQMNQFGMGGYDGSQIRQSPFFPNPFMQHHPQFGGAMTGMLANVAATPPPQAVQGFGAGFSQAAQGMMGGPEMLRQYQVRQMMAPMQLQGAMLPAMDIERKQQLLGALQGALSNKEDINRQNLDLQRQTQADKNANEESRLRQQGLKQQNEEPKMGPYGVVYPGSPEEQQTLGSGHVGSSPLMGPMFRGQGEGPQQGKTPGTGEKPRFEPYSPEMLGQQSAAKEAPKTKGKVEVENIRQSGANARNANTVGARRDASKLQGGHYQDQALQQEETLHQRVLAHIDTMPNASPEEKAQLKAAADQHFNQQTQGINQRYNQPQAPPPPALISPGANTNSKKPNTRAAGGQAATSGGTGQPQPQGQQNTPQPSHMLNNRPIAYNGSQWVYTDDNTPAQ